MNKGRKTQKSTSMYSAVSNLSAVPGTPDRQDSAMGEDPSKDKNIKSFASELIQKYSKKNSQSRDGMTSKTEVREPSEGLKLFNQILKNEKSATALGHFTRESITSTDGKFRKSTSTLVGVPTNS